MYFLYSNAFKKIMRIMLFFVTVFTYVVPFSVMAKPKTTVSYGYSLDGFVRVKIKNETIKDLACWVAIDGFKKKFRLPAMTTSQWFTTNDKRYTYSDFSTWCDYIDLHPEYNQYNRGN